MFGKEPAVIIGVVNAVIALAVGFGLDVTPEQVGLINAAVAAILALVTRSQVEPTSKALGEGGFITTDAGGRVTISGLAHQVEDAIEHSKEKGQSAVNILLIVLLVLVILFVADRLF